MSSPPFDEKVANRWFAVELNNLSWDLLEADSRSEEEIEMMIHAAHSACYHWLQVGDLLNHERAQCLLATAYATAGFHESAVRHAHRCLALSEEAGDRQTAFDRASAYGCAAKAFALANGDDEAIEWGEKARRAAELLSDPGDKELFEKLYG